ADPFAARAAKGQRRVDLVLDLDQRVENHRAAVVHVDAVLVDARVLAGRRVVSVDFEGADVCALGPAMILAGLDLRVARQTELRHFADPFSSQYVRAFGGIGSTSSVNVLSCTGR